MTELDAGDDLRQVTDADVVISTAGSPHILTRDHLREHHRLVVDAGFSPRGGGVVFGDVHPNAMRIPQYLTPVPGLLRGRLVESLASADSSRTV